MVPLFVQGRGEPQGLTLIGLDAELPGTISFKQNSCLQSPPANPPNKKKQINQIKILQYMLDVAPKPSALATGPVPQWHDRNFLVGQATVEGLGTSTLLMAIRNNWVFEMQLVEDSFYNRRDYNKCRI